MSTSARLGRARLSAKLAALVLCVGGTARAQSEYPTSVRPDSVRWTRLAAESWLERARARAQRGDTIEAITAYTEALRIDPSSGAATLGLAELRTLLGDFRESERLLGRATAIADVRAEAFARRSALYLGQGRAELALSDLRSAAEADPRPERFRALGRFYLQRRAWVPALAVFRRLRATMPAQTSERERLELEDTLAALAVLSAEADAVQHDMAEVDWLRTSLRHTARTQRVSAPAPPVDGSVTR